MDVERLYSRLKEQNPGKDNIQVMRAMAKHLESELIPDVVRNAKKGDEYREQGKLRFALKEYEIAMKHIQEYVFEARQFLNQDDPDKFYAYATYWLHLHDKIEEINYELKTGMKLRNDNPIIKPEQLRQEKDDASIKLFGPLNWSNCKDFIVVLGHSIERTKVGSEIEWKPTRLIQELNKKGGFRTGQRNLRLDPNDEKAYVGGGTAVTLAAFQLFKNLTSQSKDPMETPITVIFAAGRPKYLEENASDRPELAEGLPMLVLFQRKLDAGLLEMGGYNFRQRILKQNKNTRDDIVVPLEIAVEKGIKNVHFVMLEMRIERAREFYNETIKRNEEYKAINVSFVSAESLLKERYAKHQGRLDSLNRILRVYNESKAFEVTAQKEKEGVEAIKQDSYKGTGNY